MRTPPQLSVVVPAYNEERRITPTLLASVRYLRAHARPFEIVVVDDGSTDDTSIVIERLQDDVPELRLIRLAENRGKGLAVRTGVVNARGRRVLFLDADGSTPFEELERLEAALDGGATIAIGSRAVPGAAVQVRARLHRRIIGRAFHLLVRMLAVRGIRDTQCGFKLFDADVAQDLFTRMRMCGYSFDVELIVMARLRGYAIAEVPVNWEHRHGSRIRLVRDSLRMARDLFAIRAMVLGGAYDGPHLAQIPRATPGAVVAGGETVASGDAVASGGTVARRS